MGQMALGFCVASVLTVVLPSAIAEGRGAIVANSQRASPAHAVTGYANLPIRFEPNVGQASAQMEYVARGNGYTVGISEQGVVLSLRQGTPLALLHLRLVHAGARPQLRAERQQRSVSNYFIGNDSSKWHHNVANYAAVRYQRIYPGIDWVLYGNPRQLEYDFVVAPRADPRRIELGISGADSLTLTDNGDLMVNVQGVTLRQLKPVVYQTAADGARHQVDGHYVLNHQHVTFALGDYDHTRELIIDPAFVYSTYLGGGGFDMTTAIAADSEGNDYVVGTTSSTDFPTEQALQGSNLERNFPTAFIAKFNAAGTALVYSTYLGGSGSDRTGNLGSCGPTRSVIVGNGGDAATAIAVDAAGNAYVAGVTGSSDFPTVDPFQATNHAAANHGSNAFLAKLNAAGNALIYSTYLGGSGAPGALITGDSAAAVAVDGAGAAYVTGITMSPDFPTLMPFQATNEEPAGNPTAFVAKFNAAGNALVYSSYLGGSGGNAGAGVGDCANAIAVDGNGNAYVAGQTSSANFPTAVAFQPVNRSLGLPLDVPHPGSAFVTKLNSSGSALIYSTYLGGSAGDAALAVAADASGDAYVSGYTWSSDFPTSNALQPQNATGGHGANAFVTKLNAAGSELIYSTYLGGSTDDQANAIALDGRGNAYVAGSTYSNDFPVVEPLQTTNLAASHKANNAFISVLSPTGSTLEFSTYLGGSGSAVFISCPVGVSPCGPFYNGDSASAIAVDSSGNAYVTGFTSSTDLPTVMAFQTRPTHIFVTKVAVGPLGVPLSSDEVRPSTNGGSGAMGWNAIGILGLAMATRRRKPARTLKLNFR